MEQVITALGWITVTCRAYISARCPSRWRGLVEEFASTIPRPAASLHPDEVPPGVRAGDSTFWLPRALAILTVWCWPAHFPAPCQICLFFSGYLQAEEAESFPSRSLPFSYNIRLLHKDTGDLTRLIPLLQSKERPCAILVPFGSVLLYAPTKSVPRAQCGCSSYTAWHPALF